MNNISIAHLYYDIMNLYGENANVRALTKQLEKQEIKVTINFLSIEDNIDFSKYDIFYIGAGTLENTLLILKNLQKYKQDIKKAIEENKFFLVTGDSITLFGKNLIINEEIYETLDIFPFTSKEIDFRIVGEQFYKTQLIDKDIIGFQNRETIIDDYDGIFTVESGTGFKPNNITEGIMKNNFLGTYLLGPLLVRNPFLTKYLIKKILEQKNIKYKEIEEDISYRAYQEYINNFKK